MALDIWMAKETDCPRIRFAEVGRGVTVKVEDGTMVRALEELAVWLPIANENGPVVTPVGITKVRLVAVVLLTGTVIEPPPSLARVT